LEEVRDATGALERLVKSFALSRNRDVRPEFLPYLWDAAERFLKSLGVARHAAFVPEQETELAMKGIDRAFAIYVEHPLGSGTHLVFRFFEFRMIGRGAFPHLPGEVVRQGVGKN